MKDIKMNENKWFVANDNGDIIGHDMGEAKAKALAEEMQEKEPDAGWEAMGCDHEYHEKKVEEVAEKTNEEKLEELKKEHPLVTNEKCFTLSWFPETIPSVLSEEEENVSKRMDKRQERG